MTTTTANKTFPQSVKNLQKTFDPENIVLAINPDLAKEIGIDNAHLISQIHYWLQNNQAGYIFEGVKWIYNGYKAWAEQLCWLSEYQIGRLIRKLEDQGFIITDNFHHNTRDRRKWYCLNYQLLKEKTGWNPLKLTTPLKSPYNSAESKKEKSPPKSSEPPLLSNVQNCTLDSTNPQNASYDCCTINNKDYPENTKSLFRESSEKEFSAKEENTNQPKQDGIVQEAVQKQPEPVEEPQVIFDQQETKLPPIPKPVIKDKRSEISPPREKEASTLSPAREKYEWEDSVGSPYPDFIRWRANLHYKPQGGHWESGASSHAMSEITKKSESSPVVVRWMWQEFLEYAQRSIDNALMAESMGSTPSLPSCFEEKEIDQEAVSRKLLRAKESVEKVNQELNQEQREVLSAQGNEALTEEETEKEETEEETFLKRLQQKLMWCQAKWKAYHQNPKNLLMARLWEKELEVVQTTPGLMMTHEGPVIDPDFVFVPNYCDP